MGHLKVFRGNGELLRNLKFVSDSFFLLSGSLFFFNDRSRKEIKDGKKKTRISLNSIFILAFTTILW